MQASPAADALPRAQLTALCVPLAGLGIASLSVALASSLATGALGIGPSGNSAVFMPAWLAWPFAVLDAGWAVAVFGVSFLAFRRGAVPRPELVAKMVAVAAGLHLATLLIGLWREPASTRFFDVTVASTLALELSVLACLGWMRRHNGQASAARYAAGPPTAAARQAPSAAAVLGVMFVAAIVVAAITTTGLAGSTAGELAVPHSGHGGHSHTSPSGTLLHLEQGGHHH